MVNPIHRCAFVACRNFSMVEVMLESISDEYSYCSSLLQLDGSGESNHPTLDIFDSLFINDQFGKIDYLDDCKLYVGLQQQQHLFPTIWSDKVLQPCWSDRFIAAVDGKIENSDELVDKFGFTADSNVSGFVLPKILENICVDGCGDVKFVYSLIEALNMLEGNFTFYIVLCRTHDIIFGTNCGGLYMNNEGTIITSIDVGGMNVLDNNTLYHYSESLDVFESIIKF